MQADWLLIRDMFATDAVLGFTFTKTMFNDTMRVIKDTRNELFHSNPIKDRKKIVDACDRILNGLHSTSATTTMILGPRNMCACRRPSPGRCATSYRRADGRDADPPWAGGPRPKAGGS
jgi:hypothetical protein